MLTLSCRTLLPGCSTATVDKCQAQADGGADAGSDACSAGLAGLFSAGGACTSASATPTCCPMLQQLGEPCLEAALEAAASEPAVLDAFVKLLQGCGFMVQGGATSGSSASSQAATFAAAGPAAGAAPAGAACPLCAAPAVHLSAPAAQLKRVLTAAFARPAIGVHAASVLRPRPVGA